MPEFQQELGALLGEEVKQIRVTERHPRMVSVIDVAVAMTGHCADYATQPTGLGSQMDQNRHR